MSILSLDEVNMEIIHSRFDRVENGFHEVDLCFPDIGKEWSFREQNEIHPQDWAAISRQVSGDYKTRDKYQGKIYDLILVSASLSDRIIGRTANCYSNAYNRK